MLSGLPGAPLGPTTAHASHPADARPQARRGGGRARLLCAAALVLGGALSACGGSDDPTPAASTSAAATQAEIQAMKEDEAAKATAQKTVERVEECLENGERPNRCRSSRQVRKIGGTFGTGPGEVSLRSWGEGYKVIATSTSGAPFAYSKSGSGTVTRLCSRGSAACPEGTW